jgi:hypothetical protein
VGLAAADGEISTGAQGAMFLVPLAWRLSGTQDWNDCRSFVVLALAHLFIHPHYCCSHHSRLFGQINLRQCAAWQNQS